MINRQYIPLADLVDDIIDNRGKTVPTVEVGIPLIATNCIKLTSVFPTFENIRYISQETYDTWFRAHLRPGDILFVNKGTPGRCCMVPDPVNFVAAQDMVGLRFKKEYHPYYILAVLRGQEIQKTIENNHVGLVIPHLRKQELVKLKLPILSKEMRDGIGELYKVLSFKIELNNKINAELEAMAKLIYDYWFVQFDFPNEDGKPYKSSGGKMVWNTELKREIPEGWEVKDLSDVANITMGQSPPGESYNEEKIGTVFYQGSTDFGKRFPTIRKYTTEPTRFARKNDILMSVRAPVGTMNISKEDCCIGRGLAALRSKNGCMPYLFGVMSNLKQIFDRRNTDGTTFGAITKDDLFSIKVISPPESVISSFDKIVGPMFSQQNTNEYQNIELAELRDWLLPMLMNGQVKVE